MTNRAAVPASAPVTASAEGETDEHVELTPVEARQGGRGRHLAIMLGVSTLLAAAALTLFFLATSAAG